MSAVRAASLATSASSDAAATPAELFGPLLARVQERAVLRDGKTFVDAVPRRPVPAIMADFSALPAGDDALLRFVRANFVLPSSIAEVTPRCSALPLREYIRATWADLARAPVHATPGGSALPIKHRPVVPGGRFRELYYWDSFFTMLGLLRDGHRAVAAGLVDTMTDLIEAHGHVPNGTRTYYLGRSQPPLYHMMVALLGEPTPRQVAAMKREHAWWMAGEEECASGACQARVVRLADGGLLNRYWDPRAAPRDESWAEDVATAHASGRPVGEVYRDLRAAAESGWDFSSRWLDGPSLASIRTTTIAPADLNAFLYGLECAIAASGDVSYAERAARRRDVMRRRLWDADAGRYADLDLTTGAPRSIASAAMLAPLLTGVATPEQAGATAAVVRASLLAPGGLRTTLAATGEQWDAPNGWAPLQWIAIKGLRRHGHVELARQIARRWLATVNATYARTGLLFEKYDVETPSAGGGGEYAPQIGFGWTNGVTADLIDAGDAT